MIKVEYGLPKGELNKRYLQLFDEDLPDMDYKWKQIYEEMSRQYPEPVQNIPTEIKDILIAGFPTLVDIFISYLNC